MCELRVISRDGEKEQKVGEDIVYAKVSDDHVLLKDVLGGAVKIQGAIIEELDINSETLKLVSSPIIIKIYNFLDACRRCESEKVYDKELESLWNEIKASGDEAVRTIWKKYRRKED